MAEPTLSMLRDELRAEIGLYLGYGSDDAKWDTDQLRNIRICLKGGLNRFYSPMTQGAKEPYEWSFLRLVGSFSTENDLQGTATVTANTLGSTVDIGAGTWPTWVAQGSIVFNVGLASVSTSFECIERVSGTQLRIRDVGQTLPALTPFRIWRRKFDLPDNFSGIMNRMVLTSGLAVLNNVIDLVSPEELLSLRAKEERSNIIDRPPGILGTPVPYVIGNPVYAAIRLKTQAVSTSTSERYEVDFYPIPQGRYVVQYEYPIVPDTLSETSNTFLLGGATRNQAILACALAYAEKTFKPDETRQGEEYQQLLAAAVEKDKAAKKEMALRWGVLQPAYGSFGWLVREVAGAMWDKWSIMLLTHGEQQQAESLVQSGVRDFYAPAPLQPGGEGYSWTFLKPGASLVLVANQWEYDLPADCTAIIGSFEFEAVAEAQITQISPDKLLQMRAKESASNLRARYFAVRSKTSTGSAQQGYEVLFYPTPNSPDTVLYHYVVEPPALTNALPFPWGGKNHAQTILAACLWKAALIKPELQPEVREKDWMGKLSASIQFDKQISASDAETWDAVEPEYGTYDWLLREVGGPLYGHSPSSWTFSERAQANSLVNRGYRRFITPDAMPGAEGAPSKKAHQWSFLNPTAAITLAIGVNAYDLPSDYDGLTGDISFASGSSVRSLRQIEETHIRGVQAMDGPTGVPNYFALRPKLSTGASVQLWELVVIPTPIAVATLTYRYNRKATDLSESANHPWGGKSHAETILASCLAVAAEGTERHQQAYMTYQQRLSASIGLDSQTVSAGSKSFPLSTPAYGSYDWLQQEIGQEVGIGPNSRQWTQEEERMVDSLIQRGLQRFYNPPKGESKWSRSHRWSFLYPVGLLSTTAPYTTGTIVVALGVVTGTGTNFPMWADQGVVTVNGQNYSVASRTNATQLVLDDLTVNNAVSTTVLLSRVEYDLPNDVQAIDGPLTYTVSNYQDVTLISEHQVRRMILSAVSSGYPQMAGIVAKTPVAANGTQRTLMFYPTPNAVYVLSYRYKARPSVALVRGQFPLGGVEHAQTILASCLALHDPKRTDLFMNSLASSIELDQNEQNAETLGINGNREEPSGMMRRNNQYYITTHDGSLS